jgi:hypothetical protein
VFFFFLFFLFSLLVSSRRTICSSVFLFLSLWRMNEMWNSEPEYIFGGKLWRTNDTWYNDAKNFWKISFLDWSGRSGFFFFYLLIYLYVFERQLVLPMGAIMKVLNERLPGVPVLDLAICALERHRERNQPGQVYVIYRRLCKQVTMDCSCINYVWEDLTGVTGVPHLRR